MPDQPEVRNKNLYRGFIILGLYCLIPFLVLSFYAYPQADDYSLAIRDSQFSFWSIQKEFYMNWSGRFFATAVLRLNPLTDYNISAYPYYAFGVLLAFTSVLALLIFQLFRQKLTGILCIGLAALVIALYLLELPSPSESLFWLSGFLTYTLPNVLFLLMLLCLHQVTQTNKKAYRITLTLLAVIAGAMVAASNEMALLYLMATLLLIAMASWLQKNPNRHYFLTVFTVCLLVSLAVVLAPGNFTRMSSHPGAGQPLWSLVYAGILTLVDFYRWGGTFLLASLVFLFAFGKRIGDAYKHSLLFKVPLPLLGLYIIGTVFLMNFLFVWATGERPTPRLQNVIYFFLLLAWLYTLQVLIIAKPKWFGDIPMFWRGAVVALLLLSFLNLNSNISTAYLDLLSGKAAAFNTQLKTRDMNIAESNCQKCFVEPLSVTPASLYFLDIQPASAEEHQWVNDGYARYWGKATVIPSGPTPPVESNYDTLIKIGKRWRDSVFH